MPDIPKRENSLRTEQEWLKEGMRLYNIKRFDEARSAYEQAIRLNPNNARAHLNKGLALFSLGRFEEALTAYEQVLQLDPSNARAHLNRSYALSRLGRKEDARHARELANRFEPNYAGIPVPEEPVVRDPGKRVGKVSTSGPTQVFISYSHKDSKWLKRLRTHLNLLDRKGEIDLWDDTKIAAGILWKDAISDALESARVAILLISADFLASDFIAEHELPKLLERAKAGGTRIIPIILSSCLFTDSDLAAFQAVNSPEQPLSKMRPSKQEEVLMQVARTIMKLCQTE